MDVELTVRHRESGVGTFAQWRRASPALSFRFAPGAIGIFVRGREYHDRSRQDQLTERYRRLPRTNN